MIDCKREEEAIERRKIVRYMEQVSNSILYTVYIHIFIRKMLKGSSVNDGEGQNEYENKVHKQNCERKLKTNDPCQITKRK